MSREVFCPGDSLSGLGDSDGIDASSDSVCDFFLNWLVSLLQSLSA